MYVVHTGDYRVREDLFDSALRTRRVPPIMLFCLHSEEIAITGKLYGAYLCQESGGDESGESRITLAGDLRIVRGRRGRRG